MNTAWKYVTVSPVRNEGKQIRWVVKLEQSDHYCGYHPLFLLAKGVRRLFFPPCVLCGVGIPWGCFRNYFRTAEQFPENNIIRFLQTEQVKRLTMREGIWR